MDRPSGGQIHVDTAPPARLGFASIPTRTRRRPIRQLQGETHADGPPWVTLFTGQWADLTLEVICQKASQWGYDGIELPCWGDHFPTSSRPSRTTSIARAATTSSPSTALEALGHLQPPADRQLVLDVLDAWTDDWAPAEVRGDSRKKQAWAVQEMKDTARAAQKLGVKVVNGFTGSSIWHLLYSFPPVSDAMIADGFKLLAERWNPLLDVFKECGVKFAREVHPTEIAFDLYSAKTAPEASEPPP